MPKIILKAKMYYKPGELQRRMPVFVTLISMNTSMAIGAEYRVGGDITILYVEVKFLLSSSFPLRRQRNNSIGEDILSN